MAELIRRDAIDAKYITSKTVNFEQVKESLLKHDLGEVASITGVSAVKLQKIVAILSDRSKKVVAYYHMESRIERSTNDLKALVTLLSMLGKIGVEGSGLALVSGQCNNTGMQIAGFDNKLLPGGVKSDHTSALQTISGTWKTDLAKSIDGSGTNIGRKIREDKIRAAIILGENPAIAPDYNSFVNNLEFLIVADMFLTETAQSADVFLPLSGYLETPGHLTNWSGMHQQTNPIGEPMNGFSTADILTKLANVVGYTMKYNKFEDITAEMNGFIQQFGIGGKFNGKFLTEDGKMHFILYSDQVIATPATSPKVLEIDARMIAKSKKG